MKKTRLIHWQGEINVTKMITGNSISNTKKYGKTRFLPVLTNRTCLTVSLFICRYESTMARNLYEKLMNKYEANPEDPMAKFTKSRPKNSVKDTNSTLARMKEALSKGKIIL